MLKCFGMNTLCCSWLVSVRHPLVMSMHRPLNPPGGITDLTRVLSGLEEESYRARLSKDTKFWDTFLSENFVSWGLSGRIDKAAARREWSGTNCEIVSYQISDPQVSRLTPQAAVITHKTTVDGSCGKDRLPIASWTATGYVLEGTQWKAVFRAGSAVVDPAKLPKRTLDVTAGAGPSAMTPTPRRCWAANRRSGMRGRTGTRNGSTR